MNAFKFRKALEQLGLTQGELSRRFGYSNRTVRRWASGDHPVPHIIVIVLWLMEKFKVEPESIPTPADEEAEFYAKTAKPVSFTSLNSPRSRPERKE